MKNKSSLTKFLAMSLGLSVALPKSAEADVTWNGATSTDWSTTTNWSANPAGQNVLINSGTTVTGNSVPIISAGPTFTPVDIIVGVGTSGRVDQRAGTVTTGSGNWLFVGRNNGGNGIYNLADTSTSGGTLTGFGLGSGSLNIGNGHATSGRLLVGETGSSVGTFNMNTSGTLTTRDTTAGIILGDGGSSTGTFNLDAGTINTGGNIAINMGNGGTSTGNFNVSGGAININSNTTTGIAFLIGTNGGDGNFNMSGGTVTGTGGVWVGDNSAGSQGLLSISGGTFTATSTGAIGSTSAGQNFIGRGLGQGVMNVSGSANVTFNGATNIGFTNTATVGTTGTLNVSGGTLTNTGDMRVGAAQNSNTIVAAGAGTLNVTGGTVNIGGVLQLAHGNDNGDVVTGTALVNGGTLNVENDFVVAYAGNNNLGQVTISSGTVNVATTTERWMMVNQFDTSRGQLTVNGGTLNLNANTDLRFSAGNGTGTSFATLQSGAINGGAGSVVDLMQANVAGNNTFNLDGGTLTISQIMTTQNSGTAVFNFNGGTLKASVGGANFLDLGGAAQTAVVKSGGALINSNGFNVTAVQALLDGGGGGGLTKSGSGTLTLTGSNTYTGTTTVSGGTLTLGGAGSINSSSGITVNGSGAKLLQTSSVTVTPAITLTQGTLDGTGTVGAVTVGDGTGGIVTNGNGTTTPLTLGSLIFNGVGTINVNTVGSVGLAVTGALNSGAVNTSGTTTINPNGTGGTWSAATPYDLITYGSLGGQGFGKFALGSLTGYGPRFSGALGNSGTSITLTLTGDTPKWTGLDSGNWVVGTTGTAGNWKLIGALTQTNYIDGDLVLFDDTASTTAVNISAANVSPSLTTFSNDTKNYTVSSSGTFGIAGSGSLVKSGTGSVTLTTVNTYTGATTINNGTLQIGDGTTDGSISTTSNIVDNGTLVYNRVGSFTYGGLISGTGALVKSGTGTQILTAANTYSGGTTINAGTLNITQTTGSAAAGTFDLNGGRLEFAPTVNNFNLNNTININSGGTTIGNVGTAQINLTGVLNGNGNALNYAAPTGNVLLYFNTTTNTVSAFNIQSGAMGFDLNVGNQGGAAPVNVSNGASLWFANASNFLFNPLTLNGTGRGGLGALFQEGNGSPTLAGSITLASDSTIGGSGTTGGVIVNGQISGSASLTKVGTSKYIFAVANNYTGSTIISAGTVQLGNGGTTGSLLTSSTISIASAATLAFNRSNAVTQGVDFGVISGTTGILTQAGSGALTLAGANSITTLNVNNATGTVDIGAGNLTIKNAGNFTIQSTTGGTINATGGGKIVLSQLSTTDGPDIGTANGTTLTINASITGTSAYENWTGTNNGTGVTVLTATNDYTGDTIINGGVLSVSNIGNQGSTTSNLGKGTTIHIGVSTVSAGALSYTGTGETTNRVIDLAGTTAGGIIDQSGGGLLKFTSNFTATGAGAKTLTLTGTGAGEISGAIVNSTAATSVTKFGTGTWTLTGANTFTGNLFGKGGTLVVDSGGSVSTTTFASVGQNTGDNATMTIKGTGSVATTNDFNVGDVADSVGVVNVQDNGSLTMNALFVASANAVGSTASGTVNQSGGTVTQTGTAIGTFSIGGRVTAATGTGIYNLSGGTLNANAGIRLGDFGTGTFNQTGGLVNAKGGVNLSRNTGGIGTYNLTSGTLATFNIASSTGTNSTFNFNGGTLQAGGILSGTAFAPSATFMTGLMRANVRNGGAIINTNSNSVTIAQALLHSNIGGDNATDGGLTKNGAGTLTLTASNTYTGATTVTSGTLNLSNQFATQNSTVTMNGGSLVFDQTVAGNAFTFGGLAAASSGAGFDIALRNNAGSPAAVALITGGNNASTTYSGVLSGSGSLTKTGTGTLTLMASNSYTGLTTVSNGTLQFGQADASVVTLTGGLNVATSGTAVLTAHTGGAANVKVLDLSALTISGTTPFIGDGGKDLGGLASPAPVPEPGTIGLLAVGAIGGLLLRRRNRKSGS